jgi:competence protein ComEA
MKGFAHDLLKNYKLCIKVLAAVVLFSFAIGLYIHKGAEGSDDMIIIETERDASEDVSKSETLSAADEPDETQSVKDGNGEEQTPPQTMIVVDVGGAVTEPTVLILPEGSRVYEALESAGGLLPQADMREINKATVLKDGDRIYIPSKDEVITKTQVPRSAGGGAGTGVTNAAGSPEENSAGGADNAPININTADSRELQKLSGVGPSTAQKILDYRETNGRFERIEDIKKVSGIGDKTFEKLKDKLAVD